MVSVIVPVYNTAAYLEECIRSIAEQTFSEIEIILIDDGSTDGSDEICRRWQEKDNRIIFITKKNEGQGTARNIGIQAAAGEYIVFVDSDDYIHKELIEKVYNVITKEQADICIFEYFIIAEGLCRPVPNLVNISKGSALEDCRELMGLMNPVLWNKMYASHLLKNRTGMSNHICEDLAYIPVLYVDASRFVTLGEPLYYYRFSREGNLSTGCERYPEIENSVGLLVNTFKENHIFQEYQEQLYEIVFNLFKDILFRLHKREDLTLPEVIRMQYEAYRTSYEEKLPEFFPQITDIRALRSRYIVIGSYNLRVILHEMLLEEKHLLEYFGASSVVSMMETKRERKLVYEYVNNSYRTKQVMRDINGIFRKEIPNLLMGVDYIVMDLLEETNSILAYDGIHLTKSEFFDEMQFEIHREQCRELTISDRERFELFKKYCEELIQLLQAAKVKVILVKNYLSEKYSRFYDTAIPYEEIGYIKRVNEMLAQYYDYFEQRMPEVLAAEVKEEKLKFTYQDFPFGCQPVYYNHGYYKKMALTIHKIIKESMNEK